MRTLPLALIAMGSLACRTAPISYLAATPRPLEDAYGCTLRKINELGYQVTNTSREAGFITGTKQTSGLGTKLLTGSEYHDQLTVSIFDAAGGKRTIRVTAGRVDQQTNLFGTSTNAVAPTDKGKRDANDVLASCGEGPVTQQGAFAFERHAIKSGGNAVGARAATVAPVH